MRIFATFVLCSLAHAAGDVKPAAIDLTQEEMLRRTQQLYDAVAPGNQTPWRRYLAEDVILVDELGHVFDKAAFLDQLKPLPSGYSGVIRITQPKALFRAGVAILSYDAEETETVFGQVLHARYHTVDTWTPRNGIWQITASETLRYYEDPAAAGSAGHALTDYVGTYQLAPGMVMTVRQEGDALYAQRGAGKAYPLLPESPDLFFRAGVEGRRLFHRDATGRVDMLIDRRNNEDLLWKKLE